MDDGRGPGVEEVKAFQDLPAPASQHLRLHNFETLQVALEKRQNRRQLPVSCIKIHIFNNCQVKKKNSESSSAFHNLQ